MFSEIFRMMPFSMRMSAAKRSGEVSEAIWALRRRSIFSVRC